ncbi:hypothetical protein [Paralcaligenes ureilyticus]|uniref:Uncharacterized protein n=1 Tax=Paralcaligenes ureilyticus TaxID=627131 RepID=A0A4R3M8F2_9BURK|nr:hypothetical protein [Paralcaligenes ureilyticus]TCT08863.1 hypothetical protein EDC26_10421 [Paralcaligenes ureilyticus]
MIPALTSAAVVHVRQKQLYGRGDCDSVQKHQRVSTGVMQIQAGTDFSQFAQCFENIRGWGKTLNGIGKIRARFGEIHKAYTTRLRTLIDSEKSVQAVAGSVDSAAAAARRKTLR